MNCTMTDTFSSFRRGCRLPRLPIERKAPAGQEGAGTVPPGGCPAWARYIGTEHILLGLAREREGLRAKILAQRRAQEQRVRSIVIDELALGADLPGRSA
ncbi:MAG: Clp protease N-terminal domain-containing protein [Actinomycetota bacterium]